ncbi:monovalent cation/H(+) antiporter subunit G [Anaerotignum sp.]|nr:monovalent cation/H(+) antiporter subunit G [Anaerotignum sp.]MBP3306865.1 monovalent cation/H(+) antiporter subunit G [Anaerotignum sp.]MBP3629168.1 monovalent cation/H(+) antiporter subunit G [Anaerotignum sp.]
MPVREIIAAICIIIGLLVFLCGTFGVFRLKYVLNKMHAAALGDTMGLFFIVLGLIILSSNVFVIAKFVLIILFFWLTSPIATHMLAKVELLTNKDAEERMKDK